MPGSTPSRSLRNSQLAVIPMSERQQLKLVRQLETGDGQGGNQRIIKGFSPQHSRSRSCNGRGETPLHKAAIKGDEELVNKLLQEGADPNVPDFAGWTPLHEACNHGWFNIAFALIEAGASVNAQGLDDYTPLHDAAVNGHVKLVKLLLEQGADVNSRTKAGKTPGDIAAPGLVPHLLQPDLAVCQRSQNGFHVFMRVNESLASVAAHAQMVTLPPSTKCAINATGHGEDAIDSGEWYVKCLKAIEEQFEKLVSQEKDSFRNNFFRVNKPLEVEFKLQFKERYTGKKIVEGTSDVSHSHNFLSSMEDKNVKEDVYEFKSSKEATPVRGNSASPEVDKNVSEIKIEKSEGHSTPETELSSMKRLLSDVVENDEGEDETKKKKRKEGDSKAREEIGCSSKILTAAGRVTTARNSNSSSEKAVKVVNHTLCKNSGTASKTVASNLGGGANPDRKSPGSPKNCTAPSQHGTNCSSSNISCKTEEQEEKSPGEGEKIDSGPKVPPLKIVIPQQTTNEPEPGNRNGKNGTSRHHQALPYVVSSNSNDGEKEGLRSRSASPTDSFKSDEKKDPAIGMLSAEDQKGSLHHQRVLRSSNRSGPGNNLENRGVESSTSRTGNGNGQNPSSGTSTVSTANNGNPSSGVTVTSNDDPSFQSQSRSSPSPLVESNSSSSVASAQTLTENSSNIQNASNYRSASNTPNKANGTSSSASSSANYEDKTSENNTETIQSSSQGTANPAPVELHPRKRKLKHNKEVKEVPLPQSANERCESSAATTEIHPHEQPVKNCYQLFLDIRKQIERRRKGLFPVQPKPPQGFKDYLMNRCTYVLAGNASTRQIPTSPLPQNLTTPMKDLFSEQEKERHRLRLQHVIEKEKLVLSVEQEILRVHGRAARALANQSLPFSVCTILKDEEVYNLITPEQEEKDRNARSRYNGRLFLSWLQDVDDKWEKIKEAMLLRHHNEAESLHAVQKMDWEWKLKELGTCEFKSKPVILENHVPMVHVSDDFDLLPA